MLLAFGLRIHRLGEQSIWYDEALSVLYARQTPGQLLALVAASDHPPFYFFFLHLWLRLNPASQPLSEFWVRFPSLFAGVLLIPLTYALARALSLHPYAAVIAALWIAVSPFHIWYAQEARMYTLAVFLTTLASLLLARRLRADDPGSAGRREWGLYALLMAAALYTHYYTAFILLAHGVLIVWIDRRRPQIRAWIAAASTATALALPWLWHIARPIQETDTYWPGTLDVGKAVAQIARAMAVGQTLPGPQAQPPTIAYLLLVILGLLSLLRATSRSRRYATRALFTRSAPFLSAYALVPTLTLLAIAYRHPKFAPRYLLITTPALALLAGQGAWRLASWRRRLGPILAMGLIGIVLIGRGVSLWHHYYDVRLHKPDWRAVAAYMAGHARPRDAVVIVGGHTAPAFQFYNRLGLDVYPIPPGLLPRVNHPVITRDVTDTLNRLVAEGHDRVWLILWQERLADPRRITLEQLFDHGRRLEVRATFNNLAVLLFELPPGVRFSPPQPQYPLQARFGDVIELYGYDIAPDVVPPGGRLQVRLYWRAIAPIDQDYTAFTQLLTADDRIVGQYDRLLGGDLYPTSRWPMGEPVRETYELPIAPETPAGAYRLIAGVYRRETGQRLPVEGMRAFGDYVWLTDVPIGAEAR